MVAATVLPMLILFLLPSVAAARSDDTQKPIRISADRAELDDKKGVAVYRGNVRVEQGTMLLKADVLTVHTPERAVSRMIAESRNETRPVSFRQQTDDGRSIEAEAQRMDYRVGARRVQLEGGAELRRGGDSFRGERIDYDLAAEVVEAVSAPERSRVEIVITPETHGGRVTP
ncbi:MAG: lipopolysaccharide transport periplasmic protein LptA [Chromatiales bacterium]|nr:lipopolysaccharide transport periplasmic protein LptA [Chromatiales bacterium]MDX9766399.1 lipopolysaccharide transport periplasmic protein LptA [Ectothiorhodospiraceae bacterium]